MNGIKVSVIIPVYNAEKYIEKCLDSILGQNFQDFEVILVNDGSTDRSLEICKTVSNKNKCISVLDQENQGVSIARQKGINSASGQFIAFIDADDYVKRDYLEVLYKNAIEYDVDIVCCDCTELYEDGTRGDFCCVKNSRLIKKRNSILKIFYLIMNYT